MSDDLMSAPSAPPPPPTSSRRRRRPAPPRFNSRIPQPEDLTVAYLQERVFPSLVSFDRSDVEVKGNASSTFRLSLRFEEDAGESDSNRTPDPNPKFPRTVIVKISAKASFVSALYLHHVEVFIFHLLSSTVSSAARAASVADSADSQPQPPLAPLVPILYYSDLELKTGNYILVMEDLLDKQTYPGSKIPTEVYHGIGGEDPEIVATAEHSVVSGEEAHRIVKYLAEFHSLFWGKEIEIPKQTGDEDEDESGTGGVRVALERIPDGMAFTGTSNLNRRKLSDACYSEETARIYLEKASVYVKAADTFTESQAEFLERIDAAGSGAGGGGITERLREALVLVHENAPKTLSHGDFRLDNMVLWDGGVISFDFQLCCLASPMHDFVNFYLFNAFEEEEGPNSLFRPLLTSYHETLIAHAGIEISMERLLELAKAQAWLALLFVAKMGRKANMANLSALLPWFAAVLERGQTRFFALVEMFEEEG